MKKFLDKLNDAVSREDLKVVMPKAFTDMALKNKSEIMLRQKGERLCDFLKSFGFCYQESHCGLRHFIYKGDTTGYGRWLGVVKGTVCHVKHASSFFIHVSSLTDELGNKHTNLATNRMKIECDVATYFSSQKNR